MGISDPLFHRFVDVQVKKFQSGQALHGADGLACKIHRLSLEDLEL